MASLVQLWDRYRDRRAAKQRCADVRWLTRLCEYHIEGHNRKDYRDNIKAHVSYISGRLSDYEKDFPDIEHRLWLAMCVLSAEPAWDQRSLRRPSRRALRYR